MKKTIKTTNTTPDNKKCRAFNTWLTVALVILVACPGFAGPPHQNHRAPNHHHHHHHSTGKTIAAVAVGAAVSTVVREMCRPTTTTVYTTPTVVTPTVVTPTVVTPTVVRPAVVTPTVICPPPQPKPRVIYQSQPVIRKGDCGELIVTPGLTKYHVLD